METNPADNLAVERGGKITVFNEVVTHAYSIPRLGGTCSRRKCGGLAGWRERGEGAEQAGGGSEVAATFPSPS
ncbi:MAG: hypothetical protein LBB48_06250 [Treponema sp.]|nr:hypothetical protein [Treponema sp.]